MKIRIFLYIFALHCFGTTFAQTSCSFATISEGPEQKEIASEVRQILGKDDKYTYMVKRVSRMGPEIHICKVNQAGNEVLDTEIKPEKFDGHGKKEISVFYH